MCGITYSGDGWSVPAAGAVFFAVIACILPGPDGVVARKLDSGVVRRTLAFEDSEEDEEEGISQFSDSGSSPFSFTGGQPSADDDATTEWGSVAVSKANDKEGPAVMVHMVDEDKAEKNCHQCEVCQAVIGPGMCQISWQIDWDDRVTTVHSACLAPFAVNAGVVQEVFNAVVQHQPFVPALAGAP